MKNFIYVGIIAFSCLSCSGEKDSLIEEIDSKAVEVNKSVGDGSVPKEKLVYRVFLKPGNFKIEDLDKMYREDILQTAEDYDINLRNMWYSLINEKLITEGSQAMKTFYINAQIKAKQNLPNVESFYKLLASSTSFMNDDEIFEIRKNFDSKNKEYLETVVQWNSEKRKKQALDNLQYENVKFFRNMAGSRN